MTPDDPRIDRPYQRGRTDELTGTLPPRKNSETSDIRAIPPKLTPIEGAPVWVKALQAQIAQSEGRMMGEIVEVERRINVRKESVALAEMSAQLTTTTKRLTTEQHLNRLWKWATGSTSATGAIAVVVLVVRACTGEDLAETATAVAADTAARTAESKASEIANEHADTRRVTLDNAGRLTTLESTLGDILAEVRALKTKPEPEPTTIVVPRKPRAK